MPSPAASHSPKAARRSSGRWRRRLLALLASLVGAALVGGLGWMLASASLIAGETVRDRPPRHRLAAAFILGRDIFAEWLARRSYDLSFIARGAVATPEATVVYLDDVAARELGQTGNLWDRRLFAQLVRRLTADGARLVFFDLIFIDSIPAADPEFAAAMKANGHVIIGSELSQPNYNDGTLVVRQRTTTEPTPLLLEAAADAGLLAFDPVDGDYMVRRIYAGYGFSPTATWAAAIHLGGTHLEDTPEAREQWRWVNYYAPPNYFRGVSLHQALDPTVTAPGFFRDQLVFVGNRNSLADLRRLGKDEFGNPYSLLGGEFYNGVEVHLTILLNYLRGDWLTRLDARRELWLVLAYGVALGALLPLLRPDLSTLVALGSAAVLAGGAYLLFARENTWYAWGIPAFIQTPLALGWAIGARYFLEGRQRKRVLEAFGKYLSPKMADRIANAEFDLRPGGTLVEVSVMFTDLEGFTTLSEKLRDPERLAHILVEYFTQTTGHVLESDGTIIKYIGDAVLAVWGAPLPDAKHPQKAALAACRLHEASALIVEGQRVRTRVGLHTGLVLAGNLGSAQRFDYTVIGDPVNFASRLEGLNKYFGTDILISDATRQRLGDAFLTRCLGEIRVAGKTEPVTIHELLGPAVANTAPPPWLAPFARALAAFRAGDLAQAVPLFEQARTERGGADGPAELYLKEIAKLATAPLPPDWRGIIEISTK